MTMPHPVNPSDLLTFGHSTAKNKNFSRKQQMSWHFGKLKRMLPMVKSRLLKRYVRLGRGFAPASNDCLRVNPLRN